MGKKAKRSEVEHPGPREPKWLCKACGQCDNFANRIQCRNRKCNAHAPQAICDAARRNAKQVPGLPPSKRDIGAWKNCKPADKTAEKISASESLKPQSNDWKGRQAATVQTAPQQCRPQRAISLSHKQKICASSTASTHPPSRRAVRSQLLPWPLRAKQICCVRRCGNRNLQTCAKKTVEKSPATA